MIKKCIRFFECYFLRRSHITEQPSFTMMFPPDTHPTSESTEAMRIKCIVQGHNILLQTEFEPSISMS